MLSSQITKTFTDNCDKNIVQQTSCEPLLPMFKGSWWKSRKSCTQRLRVAYNLDAELHTTCPGERVLILI